MGSRILIDFEDFNAIKKAIDDNTIEATLPAITKSNLSRFDIIKITLSILFTLSDLSNHNKDQSDLKLFKHVAMILIISVIKPLVEDLLHHQPQQQTDSEIIELKASNLSKWWCNYFRLIYIVKTEKKECLNWKGSNNEWFSNEEFSLLKESLQALESHLNWKILLLQAVCRGKKPLLCEIIKAKKFKKYFKIIYDYYKNIIKNEQTQPQLEEWRKNLLEQLKNIIENYKSKDHEYDKNLKKSILYGRFCKKIYRELSHTVINSDDRGFYVLMNSITEEEKKMIQIDDSYSLEWNTLVNNTSYKYKVVIGKHSFGKIRLCLILIDKLNPLMKVGQIICVKKTSIKNKKEDTEKILNFNEIMINSWNDSSVGDVGNLIFSPAVVYDIRIIENCSLFKEKVYTMQEFKPVYNGSKVFGIGKIYHNNWFDQKCYLISIFEGTSELLNRGICMTDLQPQNTLYDGKNSRGMLIDPSGVVRRSSKKELEECTIKYFKELTTNYTAPEFKKYIAPELKIEYEKNNQNLIVNLNKCMSYTLGLIVQEIVTGEMEKNTDILDLIKNLTQERISVEDGLNLLRNIGDEPKLFREKLLENTKKNYQKFGLNANIEDISKNYIKLMGSELDSERYKNVELFELESNLDDFLKNQKNNVLLLLGSSGYGKSTILQKKYLDSLNKWKPNDANDAIPIYIDLATEEDLRARWKWLNRELQTNLNFNMFSGSMKCKATIFVDGFDEVARKKNFVSCFINDLGRNQGNKIIICCRSEIIQADQDLVNWFSNNLNSNINLATSFTKRYIASWQYNKGFNYQDYLNEYFHDEVKRNEIYKYIVDKNLKSIMTTNFMLHMTLQVLPEMMNNDKINITKNMIYEKYNRNKMDMVKLKFKNQRETELYTKFENYAKDLAIILFKNKQRRILFPNTIFVNLVYDASKTCLENPELAGLIRGLDLNYEIGGKIPNEQITLGFSHDTIKNYFLVNAIMSECGDETNVNNILGYRLIVEDGTLIRFLCEMVKENNDFKMNLKKVLYKSRKQNKENNKNDKEIVNAAANAISILVAANVSFAGMDLTEIRINGANVSDGAFSGCDFSKSDLSNVILQNCKVDHAIFRETNMTNVELKVSLDMNVGRSVNSVAFSPDGAWIISGSAEKSIKLWERSTGSLFRKYEGHQHEVTSVAFSHDGTLIVSGSADNSVKLWGKDGVNLKTFKGHKYKVNSVAFSTDGTLLASGSADTSVKLWEISTGSLLKTFEGHQNTVYSVAFSPDGEKIVSGSADNSIKLWEKSTGALLKTFQGHKDSVISVAFSPDGEWIVSGSADKSIKLWEKSNECKEKSNDFALKTTLEGHQDSVNSVAFSPDGTLIISGSADNSIKIWGKSKNPALQTFNGHKDKVNSVAFSPDGTWIVSGSSDQSIKLWEKSISSLLKKFEGHQHEVNSVAFSPDGEWIVSGSADNSIKLWEKSTGTLLKILEDYKSKVNSVAFSRDGIWLAIGSSDASVKLWEISTGTVVKTFQSHQNTVYSVAFSPDGEEIVSGSADKCIKLWKKSTGDLLQTFQGHEDSVNSVVFSPDGKWIVSGSADKNIKLWGISKDFALKPKTLEGHQHSVNTVAFSPDGTLLASGSADTSIKLWEISTASLLKTCEGHQNTVYSVAFSPDGEKIVSGSADNSIKLWEKSTGALLKTFQGHKDSVISVAFSPDGEWIVSGSADNSIKLWEKSIGSLSKTFEDHKSCEKSNDSALKTFEGKKSTVNRVAFSQDETLIVSSSSDNCVYLREKSTGALLKTFEGHLDEVISVAFSTDGALIASGSADNSIKLCDHSTRSLLKTTLCNHDFNFLCKFTISSDKTDFFCKNMIIQNSKISPTNKRILKKSNSIFLIEDITPNKNNKSSNCFLI